MAKKEKKKKEEISIIKKRSGRYAVKNNKTGKYINGDEKVSILLKDKKIKLSPPKKKETPESE